MNCYALYKGDKFIDLGTAEHLAKFLNVKERTIRFYATPTYRSRRKEDSNTYIVIKIK